MIFSQHFQSLRRLLGRTRTPIPKPCIGTHRNLGDQAIDSHRPCLYLSSTTISRFHRTITTSTRIHLSTSPPPNQLEQTNKLPLMLILKPLPRAKTRTNLQTAPQTNATPHDQTRRPPHPTPLHHDNVQHQHRICIFSYHEAMTCDARTFCARRPGYGGEGGRSPVKSHRVVSSPIWYYQVLPRIIKSYPVSSSPITLSSPSITAVQPPKYKRKEHTSPQHIGTLPHALQPPAPRSDPHPRKLAQQNTQTDRQTDRQTEQTGYTTNHSSHSRTPRQRHFVPRPTKGRGGQDRV